MTLVHSASRPVFLIRNQALTPAETPGVEAAIGQNRDCPLARHR